MYKLIKPYKKKTSIHIEFTLRIIRSYKYKINNNFFDKFTFKFLRY